MVFPFPSPDPGEQDRIRALNASLRSLAEGWDGRRWEEDRWIGDRTGREVGEGGLCGLYVPEAYGGQGLSQTGYCRVFETFAQIDGTLSVVLGVHPSVGVQGIMLFRYDEA